MLAHLRARHLFYMLVVVATWLVSEHLFFWDTIQLASKHAHFFFENNFSSLLLPPEIDSGHPPAFGMYLALVWKIFGKTLPASHFAMLPFLLLIVWAASTLGDRLIEGHRSSWLLLLLFADPVFASQAALVSPDIALVCFFLLALSGHFRMQNSLRLAGYTGLMVISTRGMMVATALALFEVLVIYHEYKPRWKQRLGSLLLVCLPGAVLAGAFLTYHWLQTGWVGYHAESTWAPSFERVDFSGFLRNVVVLSWRLADFGRIVPLAMLGWFLVVAHRNEALADNTTRRLLWLTACLSAVLFPPLLLHKGLLGHRYLLPVMICLTMLLLRLIPRNQPTWNRLLLVTMLSMASGNFWVYPQPIATGWDSTLAHLPWYSVQRQMMKYIDEQRLPLEKIGTAFPNIGPRELIELNGRQDGFVPYDLRRQCMVLYSNVMNDFSADELETLRTKWRPVVKFSEGLVTMILYENPDPCEN